jgi:hypothetical protein
MDTAIEKSHAHELIDQLGPGQFDAVVRLLECIVHPGDDGDDDLTEEDRRAIAASREYFRQNPEGGISFEQVVAECGFSMEQIRDHKSA